MMKFHKRTDAELFKELRINVFILGVVAVIIFVAGIIWTDLGSYWYSIVLLFIGILLISYAGQKYLQERPKLRIFLMWVLALLVVVGIVIFLILSG